MHTSYLALLRGINVGGNNKLSMAELTECLTDVGLVNVSTYIQSGNVFFEYPETDSEMLAHLIEKSIKERFKMDISTVVLTKTEWQDIIQKAPANWGVDSSWKHNLLVLLKPYDMSQIVEQIGTIKPDIELLVPGNGVLYQSMSKELFGRTTTGKLASSPVYKRMTVRNYNTTMKLLDLLQEVRLNKIAL